MALMNASQKVWLCSWNNAFHVTVTLRTGVNMEEKSGGEGEEYRMVICIQNVSKVIIFFLGHEETLGIFK